MSGRGTVELGTGGATAADVIAVARRRAPVRLGRSAIAAMNESRRIVEAMAAGPVPVYGVSTGFGALATRHIDPGSRPGSNRACCARTRRAWGTWSTRRSPAASCSSG